MASFEYGKSGTVSFYEVIGVRLLPDLENNLLIHDRWLKKTDKTFRDSPNNKTAVRW